MACFIGAMVLFSLRPLTCAFCLRPILALESSDVRKSPFLDPNRDKQVGLAKHERREGTKTTHERTTTKRRLPSTSLSRVPEV